LGLPVQSPTVDRIESELRVLADLAYRLISGEYLEAEDTIEYEDRGTKVTAMPLYRNSLQYLFTIEESEADMKMAIRSILIPELFIALPSPLVVKFGGPTPMLGELC